MRTETSPEDIHGMHAAAGILTARGGMTSHAAVVARGMGRPCVSGAGALRIDAKAGTLHVGSRVLQQGRHHHHRRQHGPGAASARAKMRAAGAVRRLRHADGLGGCRAAPGRARQRRYAARRAPGARLRRRRHRALPHRAHVLRRRAHPRRAPDDPAPRTQPGRRAALAKILPMQRADFEQLFEIMAGLPVTDPPARSAAARVPAARRRRDRRRRRRRSASRSRSCRRASRSFPSSIRCSGFRGCRLAIRYPEITEMQARAIFEAAVAVESENRQDGASPRSWCRSSPTGASSTILRERHRAARRGGREGDGRKLDLSRSAP